MMDNLEILIEELEKFEKESTDASKVPEILEKYLKNVATNGDTLFPWPKIRHLIRHKLSSVMSYFHHHYGCSTDLSTSINPNLPVFAYAPAREKLLQHFDTFAGIPFTIQRLCEILVCPTKHYKKTDKFLRGLEKNILIVSYTDPKRPKPQAEESPSLVNGLEGSGSFPLALCSSPTMSGHHHGKRSNNMSDAEMNDEALNGEVLASNGTTNESGSSSSSTLLTDESTQQRKRVKLDTEEHQAADESSSSSSTPLSDDVTPQLKRQKVDIDERQTADEGSSSSTSTPMLDGSPPQLKRQKVDTEEHQATDESSSSSSVPLSEGSPPLPKRQKLDSEKHPITTHSLLQERLQAGSPSSSKESTNFRDDEMKDQQDTEVSGNETLNTEDKSKCEDEEAKLELCDESNEAKTEFCENMDTSVSTLESVATVSTDLVSVDYSSNTKEVNEEPEAIMKDDESEDIEAKSSNQSPDNTTESSLNACDSDSVLHSDSSEVEVGPSEAEVECSFSNNEDEGQWASHSSPDNSEGESNVKTDSLPDSAVDDFQSNIVLEEKETDNSEAAAVFDEKMEYSECDSQQETAKDVASFDLEADSTAQHPVMQESSVSCDSMSSSSNEALSEIQYSSDAKTSSEKEECTSSEQSTEENQVETSTDQKSVDSSSDDIKDDVVDG